MLPINWNTAIQYAILVKIAESVVPTGSYGQNEIGAIGNAGYTFQQTLSMPIACPRARLTSENII
jgi:hypothetical protein